MSDDVCFVERSVYDALSLRRPWVASKPLRAETRPDTAPQKPAKHHSALSWADHAWFLTALEARATLSATDARRLAELSATVDTEQAAYRATALLLWTKTSCAGSTLASGIGFFTGSPYAALALRRSLASRRSLCCRWTKDAMQRSRHPWCQSVSLKELLL